MAELLKALGLESPRVIAHDIGGATMLRAHLLHASAFERLIRFDPVLVRPWGTAFLRQVRQHEEVFAGLPALAHGGLLDAYIQSAASQPLREGQAFSTQSCTFRRREQFPNFACGPLRS